ncbi:MAG: HNH endonuclease [Bacteroidia bacterium]|nr:HNH endonuclease [Bacteroidia bacterium]
MQQSPYIWERIWQWACRRHPNKNKHWIGRKYFRLQGTKGWALKAKVGEQTLALLQAYQIPIKRYVKIKKDANPYDLSWEEYFEKRAERKVKEALRNGMLRKLWEQQSGKCGLCRERITLDTFWETHHILPKHLGGKYILRNLVMLHPECHKRVHAEKLRVEKPGQVTTLP